MYFKLSKNLIYVLDLDFFAPFPANLCTQKNACTTKKIGQNCILSFSGFKQTNCSKNGFPALLTKCWRVLRINYYHS